MTHADLIVLHCEKILAILMTTRMRMIPQAVLMQQHWQNGKI